MSKAEQTILASRTPEEYVDNSVKSKLPPALKAKLAREWMKKTGFSRADILYARNRHPYWKRKKMENSDERAKRRLSEFDYSNGQPLEWTSELVGEFLLLNEVGADGRYRRRDRELAKHFKTTIPSIQYMRRKFRAIKRMLGDHVPRAKFVEYLGHSESLLKKGSKAVEEYGNKPARPEKKREKAKRPGTKDAKPGRKPVKTQAKKTPPVAKASAKKPAAPKKPVAKAKRSK